MTEMERQETRYFWSGWFEGQSFGKLAAVFALLSFVDLLATLRTMATGLVHEGNALANSVLMAYGPMGFVAFKALLVLLVIGVTWVVDRSNPRLARGVLWGGILLMTVITLIHLANLASLLILSGK